MTHIYVFINWCINFGRIAIIIIIDYIQRLNVFSLFFTIIIYMFFCEKQLFYIFYNDNVDEKDIMRAIYSFGI